MSCMIVDAVVAGARGRALRKTPPPHVEGSRRSRRHVWRRRTSRGRGGASHRRGLRRSTSRGHWRGPEHRRDGGGAAASRYAAAVCPCRGGGPTATKDAADVANASRGRGRWHGQDGQAQAWPGPGPGRRNRAWLLPHWGAAARRFKRGGGRSAACCGRPYGRPKQEEGRPRPSSEPKGAAAVGENGRCPSRSPRSFRRTRRMATFRAWLEPQPRARALTRRQQRARGGPYRGAML